jgi:hypothetical protein
MCGGVHQLPGRHPKSYCTMYFTQRRKEFKAQSCALCPCPLVPLRETCPFGLLLFPVEQITQTAQHASFLLPVPGAVLDDSSGQSANGQRLHPYLAGAGKPGEK